MVASGVYQTSPLKRIRRTNGQLAALDAALVEIVTDQRPMTVRQVFYRAEVLGLVEKSEQGYDVVQRRLVDLRERSAISWDWITDGTRWIHGVNTYDGLDSFMDDMAGGYRRDAWRDASQRVEIWLEKDALTGVLCPVADKWGLPLYVTRGFASLSYLHQAARQAIRDGRPVTILVLTDLDPSGIAIAEHVEEKLRRLAPDVEVVVERLAVNPTQVTKWNLPTRPTKSGDTRARWFVENYGVSCTELDAIEPKALRKLVDDAVASRAPENFEAIRRTEELERETLRSCARSMGGRL
jgi:hypothetical protein